MHVISMLLALLIHIVLVTWINGGRQPVTFTLSRAPVSWKSTLQSTVALSNTEVEYMTLIEVVKETILLGGLLDEMGVGHKQISIYSES